MTPHPRDILAALATAGFTARLDAGRLIVNPFSKLTDEQKAALKANRAAVIAWLASEADDDARIDAVVKRAAVDNPFDDGAAAPVLLRESVLLAMHADGEPPAYEAFDPAYLRELQEWCALRRRDAEESAARGEKRRHKKQRKAQRHDTVSGGFLDAPDDLDRSEG